MMAESAVTVQAKEGKNMINSGHEANLQCPDECRDLIDAADHTANIESELPGSRESRT